MQNSQQIVFFGFNPIKAAMTPVNAVKKRIPRLDRFSEKQVIGAGLGLGALTGLAFHRLGNYNTQMALEATKKQYGIKDELPN